MQGRTIPPWARSEAVIGPQQYLDAPTEHLYKPVREKQYSAASTLDAMDAEGIDIAVVYRTFAHMVVSIDDLQPDYATAYCTAFNDWLAEYCRTSNSRSIFKLLNSSTVFSGLTSLNLFYMSSFCGFDQTYDPQKERHMEARYARRKAELLQDCQVAPEIFDQVLPRLYRFLEPFVSSLSGQAAPQHANTYVSGLLSDVERKNVESIAYHVGQNRLGLQGFIGWEDWDDTPMRQELLRQVGQHLGQGDGVLVVDPSAFPKSGHESVGVARQWCGRLGKVDNCQVAIYLGYVSRKGHTLVDQRLYLPKDWTREADRLSKAGVPKARRGYRTRHQLALEMLAQDGPLLPHRWLAGDDEMGRPYWFRRRLRELDERYLLAVPSNTSIRDLETPEPEYSGRGRRPKRPWQRVSEWPRGWRMRAGSGSRSAMGPKAHW